MSMRWWLAGVICLAVAAVYLRKSKTLTANTSGWRRAVLAWGHSAAWIFLALAAFAQGMRLSTVVAASFGLLALVAYATFLVLLLREGNRGTR